MSVESQEGVGRRTGIITIAKPSSVELKFTNEKTRSEIRTKFEAVPESVKNKTNLRNILLNSNATPIKCKDSSGYGCAFCNKQYPEPMNLKKHFLEDHNNDKLIKDMSAKMLEHIIKLDITLLNCALCDQDIRTIQDLIVHLKSEHDKPMYAEVKSQIIPFRFDSAELRCAICNTEFTTFKLLREHMNSHFPNYLCTICGTGFVTDRLRTAHEKRHGDGNFKCNECDKTFPTVQKRRMHKNRTHRGFGKRNKCKFCDEKFMDYWKKIDHMVKEHGMPPVVLKCHACERTFNNQRSLTYHTKKDHLLERRHRCSECDMTFFDSTRLKEHMTKHTGLRQFKCEICFKTYGRRNTLRVHMRTHANDRRFICARCEQSFVQKCSWRSHMRSKHGESINAKKSIITIQTSPRRVTQKRVILIQPAKRHVTLKKVNEVDKHLENVRMLLLSSNATPIRRYGSIGYACCFCEQEYADAAELKKHTLNDHDNNIKSNFLSKQVLTNFLVKLDITSLSCRLCKHNVANLDQLVEHLTSKHEKTFHADVKNHIIPFRFDASSLKCVVCSNPFNNFKVLLQHMNLHYENYVCEVCGKGFINRKILLTHMLRHKTGVFACSFCSKVFDTRIKQKDHERAIHVYFNKRSKCGYCGERFSDYTKKNEHEVKVHGVKPLVLECYACQKTFDNQRSLTVHTKSYHLMERRSKKT